MSSRTDLDHTADEPVDLTGLLIDGRPVLKAAIDPVDDFLHYTDEHGVDRWLDLYLLRGNGLNPRIKRVRA